MAAINSAGQVPMTVAAKVTVAGGKKPASVVVDLWPVGGAEQMPMHEDPARPGMYAASFRANPTRLQRGLPPRTGRARFGRHGNRR